MFFGKSIELSPCASSLTPVYSVRLRVLVQQEVEDAERADRGDLQRALRPRVRAAAQSLLPEGQRESTRVF